MKLKRTLRKITSGVIMAALLMSCYGVTNTNIEAASYRKDWNVYYASPSSYVKSQKVVMPYQHMLTHYVQADSITGQGQNKRAFISGVTVRLYNIPTSTYVNSYTLNSTTQKPAFRPYPINGEPENSTFLVDSAADLNGVYYIDGYIEYVWS